MTRATSTATVTATTPGSTRASSTASVTVTAVTRATSTATVTATGPVVIIPTFVWGVPIVTGVTSSSSGGPTPSTAMYPSTTTFPGA